MPGSVSSGDTRSQSHRNRKELAPVDLLSIKAGGVA